MSASYGTQEESDAELRRLKAEVIEVLRDLDRDGRIRLSGGEYPFRIIQGWTETNRNEKALVIVIGDWAQYLDLESQLKFRLSEYEKIWILCTDNDSTIWDDDRCTQFLNKHGFKRVPDDPPEE